MSWTEKSDAERGRWSKEYGSLVGGVEGSCGFEVSRWGGARGVDGEELY